MPRGRFSGTLSCHRVFLLLPFFVHQTLFSIQEFLFVLHVDMERRIVLKLCLRWNFLWFE